MSHVSTSIAYDMSHHALLTSSPLHIHKFYPIDCAISQESIQQSIKIYGYPVLFTVFRILVVKLVSHTLREEHRLKMFEYRVLRRIFGPMRDEVTGWRKLHSEFHNLYCLPNFIKLKLRIRWVGHAAHMRVEKCIQHFAWKV
jgi:hypothetical protein